MHMGKYEVTKNVRKYEVTKKYILTNKNKVGQTIVSATYLVFVCRI